MHPVKQSHFTKLQLLLELLASRLSRLLAVLLGRVEAVAKLLRDPAPALGQLGEQRARRRRGAVAEVRSLAARQGTELVQLGALGNLNTVAVEVGLEIRLGPGVKCRLAGLGGLAREVAGGRSVDVAAVGRGRAVGRMGSLVELLHGSILLGSRSLGRLVAVLLKVLLELVPVEIVKSPGAPARCCLVAVLADESTKLIQLACVRNGNTTGIQVALEAALRPGVGGSGKGFASSLARGIRGLGILLTCDRSSAVVGLGSLALGVSSKDLSLLLADQSANISGLGAVGNLDAVGVAKLGQLGSIPGVEGSVGEVGIGLAGLGVEASKLVASLKVGNVCVAANAGNKLVALGTLGHGNAASVEPGLEVGVGPRVVEPIASVSNRLASLLSSRIVRLLGLLDQSLALLDAGDCGGVLV